jgi:hypothetical protein
MTAEQIETLRALYAWLQLETGSDESMRALEAAIALAGMVCETCEDRQEDGDICTNMVTPCHRSGGGCRGWRAKEER